MEHGHQSDPIRMPVVSFFFHFTVKVAFETGLREPHSTKLHFSFKKKTTLWLRQGGGGGIFSFGTETCDSEGLYGFRIIFFYYYNSMSYTALAKKEPCPYPDARMSL